MKQIRPPESSVVDEPAARSTPAPMHLDQDELQETVRKLWRRKQLILGTMALISLLSLVALYQIQPRYTATTLIMIDPRSTKVVDVDAVLTSGFRDSDVTYSETEVLTSRQLIGKLVDKLDLDNDPDFTAPPPTLGHRLNPLNWLPDDWRAALSPTPADQSPRDEHAVARSALIDSVLGGLAVSPIPRTRVIAVNYESPNPHTAALIANTLADLYVVDQLEVKFDATQRVTSWLRDRLDELRLKVESSDKAVEAYRAATGLIGGKGANLVQQQISELTTQLTVARTDRGAADAKLKEVREARAGHSGDDALLQMLDSPLVQRLREQESTIERQIAELSAQYGERHPKMIAARAQLEDIHGKIGSEIQKTILSLENVANVARAREAAVASQLEDLKKLMVTSNGSEVKLRALEMEASANRTLMETFLSRFKETSAQESGGIQSPDSRIISRADVPLAPSSPKKARFMAIAIAIAGAVGLMLAFLAEQLDRGFRSGIQFEDTTGTPVLALIPRVDDSKGTAADYPIDRPLSAYTEAIRTVYTSLLLTQGDEPLTTIAITSSLFGEGKTTLAVSLVRMIAASGHKVILVEADLRRPSVHFHLNRERQFGLAEVLIGAAPLKDVLCKDTKSSADILLAGMETLNPSKLVASHQMVELIASLRNDYKVVIIDTAPVLAVSDALMLSHQADGTIFSCRWAATSRETAALGLKELREANARIIGAVISMVDSKKSQAYGFADTYHYYASKKYYTE